MYELNRTDSEALNSLVDGIYPLRAIFVYNISEPSFRKETRFFETQEAMRKDVERVFGVLLSRWGLRAKPCLLWDHVAMPKVVRI